MALVILITGKLEVVEWMNLNRANHVVSTLYGITLLLYNALEFIELKRIRQALDNFYDQSMRYRIRWVGVSLRLLALVALSSPITIFFGSKLVLPIFGIIVLVSVYYYVLCFVCFCVSESAYLISVAKEEEEEEGAHRAAGNAGQAHGQRSESARGIGHQEMDGETGTPEDGYHHPERGGGNADTALSARQMDQGHGV